MTWVIEAFWELSTDRPIGMAGMAPIPRASVTDYMMEEGIEHKKTFRTLIRRLDKEFLMHYNRDKR